MKIKALDITPDNFRPYGACVDLYGDAKRVKHFSAEAFSDHMTLAPLIDTPAHLGLTECAAAPYTALSMEKHDHTQEAILCAADPVLLCVATARADHPPRAEDVRAFVLRPGQAAIMERNVWHDACHGLNKRASYYWLATAGASSAVWEKIEGLAEIEI